MKIKINITRILIVATTVIGVFIAPIGLAFLLNLNNKFILIIPAIIGMLAGKLMIAIASLD